MQKGKRQLLQIQSVEVSVSEGKDAGGGAKIASMRILMQVAQLDKSVREPPGACLLQAQALCQGRQRDVRAIVGDCLENGKPVRKRGDEVAFHRSRLLSDAAGGQSRVPPAETAFRKSYRIGRPDPCQLG